jgi:imipenem/basic amino acid-specific outer membrane pore
MKLVKMSLAAAVLLGASAFGLENVKVSGSVSVDYSTNDAGTNSLFDKGTFANDTYAGTGGSQGDAALRIGVTGDLMKGLSFGVTGYGLSTLGLENSIVQNTFVSHAGAGLLDNTTWLGEAWVAGTMGNTTVKVGRQELDTPLAFTEKWSIVPNTFDAAVVINTDLPNTTLVAARVEGANSQIYGAGHTSVDQFSTIGGKGAYAFAIVNNSIKPLVVQAWYYDVEQAATAYWLQADWDCQLVKGAKIGVQYTDSEAAAGTDQAAVYAVKVAYTAIPNLNVSVAYSSVEDKAAIAANVLVGTQSKLYTEAWWNYGYVGARDTKSYNVTAEYDAGFAKLGAYYTNADQGTTAGNKDMKEVAITASKSFGPLDATLAYVNTDATDQNTNSSYNMIQAYLKYNF